jgi:GH25 family lysozyme M1 (1,4-beta-N-acetylmuramidase)
VNPVASVARVLTNCALTSRWAVGMCGQFCAVMYGYDSSGYVDALTQWQRTPSALRHPGSLDPAPGALLFWGGGSAGHGHVAIADGTGACWSIDISGAGTVSRVPFTQVHSQWGLPYLGWSAPYFQGQEWSPVMIYGLDVSNFQSAVVPSRTPSDSKPVDFCFIKATQGTSYINPRMAQQASSARAQGMVVGFYHFLEKGNINAQVDYFLAHAAPADGDLLAVDWETNPATSTYPTAAEKDTALKRVQTLRPTHRCLLYCNTSFWKNIDKTSFAGDGLWIATAGYAAGSPPVQSAWALHQYSTAGNYDHDVAAFDNRAALRAWAEGGTEVALTADDKTWITGQLQAVSLLDGKAHGSGYYLAHAEKTLAAIASQSSSNGTGISALGTSLVSAHAKLDAVKTLLDSLDLSQLPAEIAAKLESLKLVVSVTEGS